MGMKTLLTKLGTGLLIGFLTLSAGSFAYSAPAASEWCQHWNTFGDEPNTPAVTDSQRLMFHLGFFLTKSDMLRQMIQNKTKLDDATMDKIMTCYEENVPKLVDAVDQVCHLPDTSKQDPTVDKVINGYVNWCIEHNTTKS